MVEDFIGSQGPQRTVVLEEEEEEKKKKKKKKKKKREGEDYPIVPGTLMTLTRDAVNSSPEVESSTRPTSFEIFQLLINLPVAHTVMAIRHFSSSMNVVSLYIGSQVTALLWCIHHVSGHFEYVTVIVR
jgi:hypothetical protein